MLALLIPLLARIGVPERLQRALSVILVIAALVAAAVALIVWLRNDAVNRERDRNALVLARAQEAAQRAQRAADQLAAAHTARRDAEIVADRKEFDDANAAIPDQGLSDRQRLLMCRELRRTDPARADAARCAI